MGNVSASGSSVNAATSPFGSASTSFPSDHRVTDAGCVESVAAGSKRRQSTEVANGSVTAIRAGGTLVERLSSTWIQ